jgi:hypothetical protein
MRNPRSLPRVLSVLTLSALLLAGCSSAGPDRSGDAGGQGGQHGGGSGGTVGDAVVDPVKLIRAVSTNVESAGAYRVTFAMKIEASGESLSATGDGEFSDDPLAMHATYRFDQLPGAPDGMEMEMILDGSTLYMRSPMFSESAGLHTGWVSMDLNAMVPGFSDLAQLSQGQNDPSSSVEYLRGITHAEEVGTETVVGVETTHYRGTVDLSKAYHQLPSDTSKEVKEALAQVERQFGDAAMPVDVWIDGDGLPRRMTFTMQSQHLSMQMTMEIPEYGIELDLPIPAADDVTDLSRLAGATSS